MKIKEFVKSTPFKFILPIIVIWGMITIFKQGVSFGAWLHALIN